jgi:hypothetical protein
MAEGPSRQGIRYIVRFVVTRSLITRVTCTTSPPAKLAAHDFVVSSSIRLVSAVSALACVGRSMRLISLPFGGAKRCPLVKLAHAGNQPSAY